MKRKENIFGVVTGEVDNDTAESLKTFGSTSQIDSTESGSAFLPDSCPVDHSGRQFPCIHKHCQDKNACFRHNLLLEHFNFRELHFHPDDRQLWCALVFPDILKFIDLEQSDQIPDYRFVFNHRYIRMDGTITQFMHEASVVFTEDQLLPVLNLKVFFEIAGSKTSDTIVLTIFKYSPGQGYQRVFTREYGERSHPLLSGREMEIIRLCYDGLSSKMIADKLKLSIHTIKNHKRHCMEKTSTHNISELIHLCLKNNWM
ncbi:MAG: helix-turn-helix transcriptional regulator [Prolixibacteraceae bacterium]|nr:helix-turn-helix transcriptional regulator [Prolixibacteraceae bacterium]